ncbi:MAG: hypothetical protein MJ222_04555 [Bacilli bacterium]|nr:hypothetical protein [Bacilli bacterium]
MYIVHAQEKDERIFFSTELPCNIQLDFMMNDKKVTSSSRFVRLPEV